MFNTIMIVILSLIVFLFIGMAIIGFIFEKKDFNDGYCQYCGSKLRHFDTDSQGGRGYVCDKCHYHLWISWKMIDKNFKNEEVKNDDGRDK